MKNISALLAVLLLLTTCSDDEAEPAGGSGTTFDADDWSIPVNLVLDGGPGQDGIPAIDEPTFYEKAKDASYLFGTDLVIGIVNGDDVRAYPHRIMDWHEIVNDKVNGKPISIIYCPLTGTAIAWNRKINGKTTTFGVSGLIYNANIIPYDRESGSNWSQIALECVNGELRGEEPESIQVIETTWNTWQGFYPDTKVLSVFTGFARNYESYPYGNYKTSSGLLFPVTDTDNRLHPKERVHSVFIEGKIKSYRLEHFTVDTKLIRTDSFNGQNIVLIGSLNQNFIVSYLEKKIDGKVLEFELPELANPGFFNSAVIMIDQLGNEWDVFGNAIAGPNKGEKLEPTLSMMGYWFPWASFYEDPELFEAE